MKYENININKSLNEILNKALNEAVLTEDIQDLDNFREQIYKLINKDMADLTSAVAGKIRRDRGRSDKYLSVIDILLNSIENLENKVEEQSAEIQEIKNKLGI